MTKGNAEVLEALSWGPQTAQQVADLIGVTDVAARSRLRRLREAGVVAHIGRVPRPGPRGRGQEPILWAAVPDCGLVSSTRVRILESQNKALKELLLDAQRKIAALEPTPNHHPTPTKPRTTP